MLLRINFLYFMNLSHIVVTCGETVVGFLMFMIDWKHLLCNVDFNCPLCFFLYLVLFYTELW